MSANIITATVCDNDVGSQEIVTDCLTSSSVVIHNVFEENDALLSMSQSSFCKTLCLSGYLPSDEETGIKAIVSSLSNNENSYIYIGIGFQFENMNNNQETATTNNEAIPIKIINGIPVMVINQQDKGSSLSTEQRDEAQNTDMVFRPLKFEISISNNQNQKIEKS